MKYLISLVLTTSVFINSCGHGNGVIKHNAIDAAASVVEVLIKVASNKRAEDIMAARNSGNSGLEEDLLEYWEAVLYTLYLANYELELASRAHIEGKDVTEEAHRECAVTLIYTVVDALTKHGIPFKKSWLDALPPRPAMNPSCAI